MSEKQSHAEVRDDLLNVYEILRKILKEIFNTVQSAVVKCLISFMHF